MVKECHFTDIGLLHEFAFYEVCDLFDMYQKEVEEKNKQVQKDNERMESDMVSMKQGMTTQMSNQSLNNITMPQIPTSFPSL